MDGFRFRELDPENFQLGLVITQRPHGCSGRSLTAVGFRVMGEVVIMVTKALVMILPADRGLRWNGGGAGGTIRVIPYLEPLQEIQARHNT